MAGVLMRRENLNTNMHSQRKDDVRTEREDGRLQTKDRGLRMKSTLLMH